MGACCRRALLQNLVEPRPKTTRCVARPFAVLQAWQHICIRFRCATGPVAQWIRHRPTEPGIAGSSPAGVIVVLRGAAIVSCERHSAWGHGGKAFDGSLPTSAMHQLPEFWAMGLKRHWGLANSMLPAKIPPSLFGKGQKLTAP